MRTALLALLTLVTTVAGARPDARRVYASAVDHAGYIVVTAEGGSLPRHVEGLQVTRAGAAWCTLRWVPGYINAGGRCRVPHRLRPGRYTFMVHRADGAQGERWFVIGHADHTSGWCRSLVRNRNHACVQIYDSG